MRKKDMTLPVLLAEAVVFIFGLTYIGLQIYYGISYHIAIYKYICNIFAVALIYLGLTVLSCYPEKINRLPLEMCVGKIRKYSLRMIRMVKYVFVTGLMIPCFADVAGTQLIDAFSLIVIGIILFIVVFYEYRIIRIIRNNRNDTK